MLAVFQFLPFTLFGLFAGVLVDRFDARRTVIFTQAASLVFAALLAGFTLTGDIAVNLVDGLTALRGAILVLDAPARQALTFQMVGRDELPNAVALNSSRFNAAWVIGPAVGGGVVALAGAGACFAINAVSLLAVLASAPDDAPQRVPAGRAGGRAADAAARHAGGVRLRAAHAGTAWLALLVVVVVANLSFNFNVLRPGLAHSLGGGPAVFGIISACFGFGALTRRAGVRLPRPRQLGVPDRRHRRVRRRTARAGAARLGDRRLGAALRHRPLLHHLDVQRQLPAAAVRPRSPPGEGGRPLLLRLQRRRAAGRADERAAGSARRHPPGLRRRRRIGATGGRLRGLGGVRQDGARRTVSGPSPEHFGRPRRPVRTAPRAARSRAQRRIAKP